MIHNLLSNVQTSWLHLTSFQRELIDILGLNAAIWGITLTTFNGILTALMTCLSMTYLLWRWNREAKKDKKDKNKKKDE